LSLEVVDVSKQLWMHNNKKTNLVRIHNNSPQPTSHQIKNNNKTLSQKKIKNATSNNNLAWIEGRNYHAKNMNKT
jgi:hypothetical protein